MAKIFSRRVGPVPRGSAEAGCGGSGELATASSGPARGRGRSRPQTPAAPRAAPSPARSLCLRAYIYVSVGTDTGVRAWIRTGRETASRAWGAPALSGFCRRENRPGAVRTKTKGTRDGVSQDFPLPLKFLCCSPTRRRGRFSWVPPEQPHGPCGSGARRCPGRGRCAPARAAPGASPEAPLLNFSYPAS